MKNILLIVILCSYSYASDSLKLVFTKYDGKTIAVVCKVSDTLKFGDTLFQVYAKKSFNDVLRKYK